MDDDLIVPAAFIVGVGSFAIFLTLYTALLNQAVATCFWLLGGDVMTLISFITLVCICVTIIGTAAVIGFTVYKVKQMGISAERQVRLDKLDRDIALLQLPNGTKLLEREAERSRY